MEKKRFNTAVLFITFNRMNPTKESFSAIRELKPSKLYISSDGGRSKPEITIVNSIIICN